MQKTTICLIDTLTLDKVWIGKNELFSSISIGIQFADGRIWTGETIFREQLTQDAYINKVWQIAYLFSKVWKDITSIQGNFALAACISAMQENKLPSDEEAVEKLAEYVLHLGPKIQEALKAPMSEEYIEALKHELQKDWDYKVDT